MRHLCCRGVLLLLVVLLAGCAAGGDRALRRSGLLIEPVDAREIGYVANWSQNLRIHGDDSLAFVEVLGDVVVTVQHPNNIVSAVSARNGDLLWRTALGTRTDRLYRPTRAGEFIVVNSDDRLFTLRATNGDPVHIQVLDSIVAAGPVTRGNQVILGGVNGTIFAHNIDEGYPDWRYLLTDRVRTPPILVNNHVFAADAKGTYALIAAEDGALAWRGRAFGPIIAPPAADQDAIYVASRDQSLYALNRVTGDDQWIYRSSAPLTVGPKPIGTLVLQPVPDDGVVALESSSGEMRWRIDEVLNPIVGDDDQILLAGGRGLRLVDADSGNTITQVDTLPLMDVLRGPDDSLILVSPEGRLMRINPQQ